MVERQYQHMFASEPGPKRQSHRALCKSILKSSFSHWSVGPLRRSHSAPLITSSRCGWLLVHTASPETLWQAAVHAFVGSGHQRRVVRRDALQAAREAAEATMTSQNGASDAGL